MRNIIKFILLVIALFVIYFVYDYFSLTSNKNVETPELENFKQNVLNNYDVKDIEIYFSRPSLWIEINSKEKLLENEIEEIKEKLKPIINKENMDEISSEYWTKDSSLYYVYVLFNERKGKTKTNYINIELSERAGYQNW